MTGQGEGYPQAVQNPIQVFPPVAMNIFTRKFYNTLRFSIAPVQVLVEDVYGAIETVLCCNLSDIQEWFELKSKIPVIHGGISF